MRPRSRTFTLLRFYGNPCDSCTSVRLSGKCQTFTKTPPYGIALWGQRSVRESACCGRAGAGPFDKQTGVAQPAGWGSSLVFYTPCVHLCKRRSYYYTVTSSAELREMRVYRRHMRCDACNIRRADHRRKAGRLHEPSDSRWDCRRCSATLVAVRCPARRTPWALLNGRAIPMAMRVRVGSRRRSVPPP